MTTEHRSEVRGPWNDALDTFIRWDPKGAQAFVRMSTSPWTSAILPRKFVELVCIALNAACTNLQLEGTRRHIRAALGAGATREEILFVLKCAAVMSIHSCSLGAPLLLEELRVASMSAPQGKTPPATPACDRMRQAGQWNAAWDPFFDLDPAWTDAFMAAGSSIYASGILPAKEVELLSIALDASFTHMYAPGTQRHIRAALKHGATAQEIMEVLKLCVALGVQACNVGIPILDEELDRLAKETR